MIMTILAVRGEFISDFMYRNSFYDNRATLETNVILTSNFHSVIDCASHCTRRDECESMLFNMDTHACQILSVRMDVMSDTGPQSYLGWLYYERRTGMSNFTYAFSPQTRHRFFSHLEGGSGLGFSVFAPPPPPRNFYL